MKLKKHKAISREEFKQLSRFLRIAQELKKLDNHLNSIKWRGITNR